MQETDSEYDFSWPNRSNGWCFLFGNPLTEAGCANLVCDAIMKYPGLGSFMRKGHMFGSQFWRPKAEHPHLVCFSHDLSQDTIGLTTAKDKEHECLSVCSSLAVSFYKAVCYQ